MRARLLTALALLAGLLLAPAGPAYADGRVAVTNEDGAAVIDATYATTLNVSGSGYQSIKGGHGGIYVFFGTVSAGWQPSKGGVTGQDYYYVPDSESKNNQGFQKYVAFPGSDTGSSANGGQMSATGTWSTTVKVPGAVFTARDRNGNAKQIDCRKVTCGIITIGAHGVTNARNEAFTPVTVGDLYGGEQPAPESEPAPEQEQAAPGQQPGTKVKLGKAAVTVDRLSAKVGHGLSFQAQGLTPRAQVTAIVDDGVVAAGPFLVGDDGRLSGVVNLPSDLAPGTHELRIFGLAREPKVRFAVTSTGVEQVAADAEPAAADSGDEDRVPLWFFGACAAVLAIAVVHTGFRWRSTRRKETTDAVT